MSTNVLEPGMSEPSAKHDLIAREIVDAAFAVHSALGPGLLESVYAPCLAYELETRHLLVQRQVMLPVFYRDLRLDAGFRMDMVVGDLVVLEIKATERLLPIHEAQLLTYLKLSGHRLGLLINFNVTLIKHGIRRLIAKP
jgi:GxxExxY protein